MARSKGTGSIFKKTPKGPWIASFWDHKGKRREHSTRTTDKASAERILNKLVAEVALRRDLVIDPAQDRFAVEGRKALTEHTAAYIAHCERAGHDPRHVKQKKSHLAKMMAGGTVARLAELTADALELHLKALQDRGLSARSVNHVRQTAVAFYSWCVRTGRAQANPLAIVPKLDESRDRRRIRRPLTDDELARLIDVARQRGRHAWYITAALAGLRKGDMCKLTWADVDFAESTLTIRQGKARRIDVIPMHPQVAQVLRQRLDENPALPMARVWPQTIRDLTRRNDFRRAGIPAKDAEDRVVDLHALRTTLGTALARAGVVPQVAQKVMRHSDYRTTLRHYTILGLSDTAGAVAKLPSIQTPGRHAATGTMHASAADAEGHQRYCQQLASETDQSDAKRRDDDAHDARDENTENMADSRRFSGVSSHRREQMTTASVRLGC
ncbi:MAG: tyrosine-type recombinase/integrase [Phycisphaerae bacterium]